MPRWQIVYVVSCCSIIGFCLAYVMCDFAGWARLTHFQIEGEWRLVSRPASLVPSNYVGTVLWGLGGAACGAVVALPIALRRSPLPDRWLRLVGGWAMVAFVYAAAYYLWNLLPF